MSYKNPGCFIATRVCRSAERRHGEPGFPMTETRALRVRPYSPSASSVPPKKSPVPSDGFQRNRRPQPFYKSNAAVSCGKGFEPPCCRFTSRQLRLRYGHKPIYGRGLSSLVYAAWGPNGYRSALSSTVFPHCRTSSTRENPPARRAWISCSLVSGV